jgi:hypothetical protein
MNASTDGEGYVLAGIVVWMCRTLRLSVPLLAKRARAGDAKRCDSKKLENTGQGVANTEGFTTANANVKTF